MFNLEIHFRDIEKSDFVYNNIWEHAEKLEKVYPTIISGHVTISKPHHKIHGNIFHIQIRLHVPGHDIIVNKEPEKNGAHEDIYVAIRDAFDSAIRQLENLSHRQQGFVKHHETVSQPPTSPLIEED